jgi:TRAP-type C4-dicarboxylate transport system permease small subunit
MQKVQHSAGSTARFVQGMDRVNAGLTTVCGLALALMVLSVFIGVLARFVFSHTSLRVSVPWTEEVSRYLMIWTVFLGAGIACRQGKLIGVEFVVSTLPAPIGRALKYLSFLLAGGFYVLLCVIGLQWLEFGQSQTSPVLEVPMVVINLAMVVGGVLMVLNTAALVLATRLADRDIRSAAEDDELESAMQQMARTRPLADSQLNSNRTV